MTVNLLTEHYLEFLSLKGGYTGSSESFHVKLPHCWKSHVTAQKILLICAAEDYSGRGRVSGVCWSQSGLIINHRPIVEIQDDESLGNISRGAIRHISGCGYIDRDKCDTCSN